MGLSDRERERLTAVFYEQLAKYVPLTRPYHKRLIGDDLVTINRGHDSRMGSNPWVRLAVEGIAPDAQP
jgi:hypothetical protein